MSRGITENDVWQAADALLLEGARPTIERVRQKIGRGSPNTVSPHLDTWFKHLGGRIKDPGAFSAPPEVPDPVIQVAKHLWEVAQADAREDVDQRVQAAMAAAVANVEAEKERAAIAAAATFEASARATRLQGELETLTASLERERINRATLESKLEEARQRSADLQDQVATLTRERAESSAEHRRQLDLAVERAAAGERRAALEIDAARQGQVRAERRTDALERKLEAANIEVRSAMAKVAELGARLEFGADQHIAAVQSLTADLADSHAEVVSLRRLLSIGEVSLKAAETEAATARAIFERLSATQSPAGTTKTAQSGTRKAKR